MTHEERRAIADRQRIQRKILEVYGRYQVTCKIRDLCDHCIMYQHLECIHHLLPLESKGRDCSYFTVSSGADVAI